MSRAYTTPIQYGPNGCQVNIDGSQTCRETQTLEIIKEFNRVYESKLQELGSIGGGDNLLAKLHLQQDWIRDLTQQNEMLVKAVEELEKDAAERVSMLEERLQNGAQVMRKCKDNCSVYLNETFQKMDYLYNDVHNLVEFVKRVRDNKQWSIEGLDFYTINASCLLKPCSGCCDCLSFIQNIPVQDNQPSHQQKQEIVTQEAKALDNKLKDMERRLSQSPTESDVQELSFKLRLKDEELSSFKRRIADIETDSTDLRKKFKELETENTTLKDTIFQANRELEKFYEQANDYLKDRDEFKRKFKESTDALETIQTQFKSEKQALERKVVAQEETIKKMNSEQFLIKEELINTRRQSDSLTQAQNETIQALQEAMREKDKTSELVRVIPLTSEESWTSTSESTSRAKAFPIAKSSGYNDDAVSMSAELAVVRVSADEGLCAKDTCSSTCDGLKALEKVQKERDLERKIHKQEVENLKKTIEELEKGGMDAIKPLQEANELSKLEISQQRITISNLQEALKVCKNQLDDLQQRSSSDVSWATKWFGLSSSVSKTPASNNQSVHDV